jgi:LacI family transcriptional regulator
MASPRPTQKDVAKAAGVVQACVSMALNNHPRVSAKTRERIQAIARELGYKPDPYLSGLSAYRKRIRPAQFQATLAWLSNYPPIDRGWRQYHAFMGYYEGAVARASELGYLIEEHELQSKGMTSRRMERILAARNINGILLAPQPCPGVHLDFNFERFSALTFGYSLTRPELHLVTLHTFRSMELVFRRLLERGYRRPGLALPVDSDLRADHLWSSAFWSEQRGLPARQRVPPLMAQHLDQETYTKWFLKHRPDAVICISSGIVESLVKLGLRVPEDVGAALLTVPDEGKYYSGIWENPRIIGQRAVDFVVDMIHRGETGVPPVPIHDLVSGTWVDGQTVRHH